MPDTATWINAVRGSHERMAALVAPLTDDEVRAPSYPTEWSIAEVASHLGSQAEIFGLFLAAGRTGEPAPGGEVFGPIWDRWNALPPLQQVSESVAANEEFVTSLERMPPAEQQRFALSMFGTDLDLAGLAALRLSEHAVHTWDIAVALDPTATVSSDAVELLVDGLPRTVARAGKPSADGQQMPVHTSAPDRWFLLTTGPEVALSADTPPADAALELPAEALLRLVYGRLDPDHMPSGVTDDRLIELRSVFPGF